ncbi:extracellular solute-binding protein [Bacillus sp. T33-2]|uniref:extracellular solute-binding protein n=1 Tax=Bacillus sp. T33-2 TaxID=2054168 RepID=UPI000C772730|nr:extracellular solute-binding protein [Bacillus sp. T33-2]PLR89144.1 ABC transporter substrate-binding protein [Bacillus sp. T33-2]
MKKMLVLFFSLLLVLSSAACSKETANNENEETAKGPKTIKVVYKDEGPNNPVAQSYFSNLEKALKEDENLDVKFKLVEMPQGNYAEKLNLLLMSGDIPDMIYFQGGDQQIAEQDLLEDLTPYIDKSKHIKNIMYKHNKERLKNYPYLLWIKPLDSKTPVIRKDWFEKVPSSKELMENPSIDNYHKFFTELVANPPGGSNKPANAVTVAGDITELDYIFEMAFGIKQTWLKKDGKYQYSKVSDNEKEKLEFYHKLYKEGLLDPQYLTKQWDTKEKAFYDGETGVIVGTNGKVIDIYNGKMKQVNGEGAEMVVLPPAKGEYQGFAPTDITKESRGIAISSQSKVKDTVFKVLDYVASPEGQMLDRLGFEKEHYNVTDSGIDLTEKYYNEWYARFWEPAEFEPEKPLKTPLLSEPAQKSREMANEFYSEDNNFIIPEELISKWDAMENLYKEYATDIITGKRPVSDFDKFVKDWEKAGGQEVTEYANKTIK